MTVDRKSIDEMATIMRILNSQSADTTEVVQGGELLDYSNMPFDPNLGYDPNEGYNPYPESHGGNAMPDFGNEVAFADPSDRPFATRVPLSSPDTDAMKAVLEAFNAAQNAPVEAPAAPQRRQIDPEVQEALRTERTQRGARIGAWEIVVHEGKKGRSYDVVSEGGHTTIAKNLYVYDAAYGIAKKLNEGVAFNDPSVLKLLDLEGGFAKNRDDATVYRERAKKLREKGEDMRANVAEDRHDEAARQAMKAHEDILRLAGIRR